MLKALLFLTLLCVSGCAIKPHPQAQKVMPIQSENENIQFWGHSCFYLRTQGVHIMTDPVFELSYSPTSQRIIPVPAPESYQNVNVVLVTHAHPDHLSLKTLSSFPESTVILCPKPSARYLKSLKQKVIVMSSWDIETFGDVRIYAVPALHPGGRKSILKHGDGRALGYVIKNGKRSIYISGDTEFHEDMQIIKSRFKPDVALLNINSHLPAKDAIRTLDFMNIKELIPAHHGAFRSPYQGRNLQWRKELARKLGKRYHELEVGENYHL